MTALFTGEPGPLPEVQGARVTWTVTAADVPLPPPVRVRHASGYEPFVEFAARYGTEARSLFDLWTFAHFIRAHRDAFDDDAGLLLAATAFLGNVLIANHPECFWSGEGPSLSVTAEDDDEESDPAPRIRRQIRVGGTVPAILSADEDRFLEFGRTVERWRAGATWPALRLLPSHDRTPVDEPD